MKHVKALDGSVFEVLWMAVASVDGVLRFAAINCEMAELLRVFMNPENCGRLIKTFDEHEEVFEGYTVFRGIQVNYDGSMIIALSKI